MIGAGWQYCGGVGVCECESPKQCAVGLALLEGGRGVTSIAWRGSLGLRTALCKACGPAIAIMAARRQHHAKHHACPAPSPARPRPRCVPLRCLLRPSLCPPAWLRPSCAAVEPRSALLSPRIRRVPPVTRLTASLALTCRMALELSNGSPCLRHAVCSTVRRRRLVHCTPSAAALHNGHVVPDGRREVGPCSSLHLASCPHAFVHNTTHLASTTPP